MFPSASVTTSHGVWSSGPRPSPAEPGRPSVRRTSPSGLSLIATCPIPALAGLSGFGPWASVTQMFPSLSTWIPCGKRKSPAPIAVTTFPSGSILRIGSRSEPAQELPPHRSIAQMCLPSGSMSTPAVDPHWRPLGRSTQLSSLSYGSGSEFIGYMFGSRSRNCACPAASVAMPIATPIAVASATAGVECLIFPPSWVWTLASRPCRFRAPSSRRWPDGPRARLLQ